MKQMKYDQSTETMKSRSWKIWAKDASMCLKYDALVKVIFLKR